MDSVNIVVIGLNGLIFSKNYPLDFDKTYSEFNLQITPEMAPEATVIVYYINDLNGNIVNDQFKIELGYTVNNEVKKLI